MHVALKHRKKKQVNEYKKSRTKIANCQSNVLRMPPRLVHNELQCLRKRCLAALDVSSLSFHSCLSTSPVDGIVTHHLLFVTTAVCPRIVLHPSFSFSNLFHSMFPPAEHEVSFEEKHPT